MHAVSAGCMKSWKGAGDISRRSEPRTEGIFQEENNAENHKFEQEKRDSDSTLYDVPAWVYAFFHRQGICSRREHHAESRQGDRLCVASYTLFLRRGQGESRLLCAAAASRAKERQVFIQPDQAGLYAGQVPLLRLWRPGFCRLHGQAAERTVGWRGRCLLPDSYHHIHSV